MIHFIQNIGEYFASNYFDEDFFTKVIGKSGYSKSSDAIKEFNKNISALKQPYFKLKQEFVEGKLRTKDKINLSHHFHTVVLKALGYDAKQTEYNNLYAIDNKSVLPVRHILYRGDEPHLMVMEMHALIKTGEEEPDGLFEQQYHVENDETNKAQKYHRSQWDAIFQVPEGVSVSPMVINKAVSELFLLPQHRRPKYILMCAGNQYFLLESEKWFKGSYLQLDLERLFDDAAVDKNNYALFYLLLAKEMLSPKADMVLMEQLDEEAHKTAYEVTKDLKEGVINAVENIANETVFYLKQQGKSYTEIDANKLKDDCLTMVYRFLFLFYAESREDLDILPINDSIYLNGYSLEMLRDLEQVPLITESSKNGYFFHQSLYGLFKLLNTGFRENNGDSRSFKIRHLDSPIFDDEQLHYLADVKIRNSIWQDVICELSLSKQIRNKNRGRISYANLGINQLGSVYESLLAFRGFLAETEYIEVHRKRKKKETSADVVRKDGSFLVPRHRMADFKQAEIYYEKPNEESPEELRVIPEGTFIYRLSGRDRQKSASYYTPEVLTQTTVKYTLKPILEKLEKGEINALDLLDLKILEPAMGAAAFQNEVINQLAEAYLVYRQEELKQKIEPDKYREELQKIKAYIALNNIYGVDLNPTAIELGKLSLWLNVIHKDMQTPFFGYRLGVGNAVVGAWLKIYKHKQFSFEPKGTKSYVKKSWWEEAPKHLKFGKKGILRKEKHIYHFLLPDPGMVSSGNIKLLKDEYPLEADYVQKWRRKFTEPLRTDEFQKLQNISKAIDELLLEHYEMQKNISAVTQTDAWFFGSPKGTKELDFADDISYDQKQQFAEERLNPNAPYYKLKQIMDYWCALWFWDIRDAKHLPTRTEWLDDLIQIVNIDFNQIKPTEVAEEPSDYFKRKDRARIQNEIREQLKNSSTSLFTNDRAKLVQQYAEQYKFFHYELEFIEVFRENNGFDVAVGNPPWIKVTFEEKGLMSEIYPELEVRKTTAPQVRKLRNDFLKDENRKQAYFDEYIENEASAVFMNAYQNYPLLKGQQTNLYKCVLENGLHWIAEEGFLGLIHPEGVYDDPKGQSLRKEIYQRLEYHFQFVNVLKLFQEILHWVTYGVNVYSGDKGKIGFYNINNLFHPSTIENSFKQETNEIVGGLKVRLENGSYKWNIKPNKNRVLFFDEEVLKVIAKTFEDSDDWKSAKLVSIHAQEMIDSIKKIGRFPRTVDRFENKVSEGWHETNDINNDNIQRETKYPDTDKYEMIYSGPHIYTANPLYKTPRKTCVIHHDYDIIDYLKISEDYIPRTNYTPQNVSAGYEDTIKGFQIGNDKYDNWLDYYKIAFRKMLSQSGERTLSGAIIPPKTAHVNGLISIIFKNQDKLLEFNALTDSLVYDFYIKTIGASNFTDSRIRNLPLGVEEKYKPALFIRTLQLNCLNKYYAPLWEENFEEAFTKDNWSIEDERLKPFSSLEKEWSWDSPLRNYFERRQALVEIDVITAMALNIGLEELILMYNIQFPVLQQNEDDTWYDTTGNIVFTCSRGLTGVGLDRPDWNKIKDMKAGETYVHTIEKSELYKGEKVTYYAPFTKQDRVEDYKIAWAHFERFFGED